MTYLQENMKLVLASILAFALVITPLVIGYQASQYAWALGFSFIALLTIKLFYECGKYDGALSVKTALTRNRELAEGAEQERVRQTMEQFGHKPRN